jgi:exosortase
MDKKPTLLQHKSSYNWPLLIQFFILLVIIGLLFHESTSPLLFRWIKWDEDLSHAIPTLFALLFLVFRTTVFPYQRDSNIVRILLVSSIALLSLIWLVFVVANITLLANLAILLCIPIVLAASYSTKTTRFFAPTLGILLFTIPIFGQLNNILVSMSANVVGSLVHLFGITALIEGQDIFIPSGHIFIADGCSGLRYLTISMLLGYMLAILNNYTLKRALFTILAATILGLLTNWIRIFLLVVIGDLTDMKSSLMHDHEFFGWILFAVTMLPAIFFSPIYPKPPVENNEPLKLRPLPSLAALALGPLLFSLIPNTANNSEKLSLNTLGLRVDTTPTEVLFKMPPTSSEEYALTRINNIEFRIQLAQFKPATLKEKIIPYFDSLFNSEVWRVTFEGTPEKLKKMGFRAVALKRTNSQFYELLLYRYEIGTNNTSSYEIAKILQIPAAFTGNRYFNIFSISSDCSEQNCTAELAIAAQQAEKWDKTTRKLR